MSEWTQLREVGPIWGMRIVIFVARLLGRQVARAFLAIIVFYYFVFYRKPRRASREYLRRMGIDASNRLVYLHLFTFATASLDRLYFLSHQLKYFEVSTKGSELLQAAMNRGEGAIVLGAHVGSFEAMRAVSLAAQLKLVAVGYFKNAQKINQLLDSYGENSTRLVHVDPRNLGYLLTMRQLLSEGYLLALLGDRKFGEKSVKVQLLGAEVEFPLGPYALAAQSGAEILVTFGLYRGKNRYELYCESLGRMPQVERSKRDELYREFAQRYALLIEKYCRKAPLNWFNFYDYFAKLESTSKASSR